MKEQKKNEGDDNKDQSVSEEVQIQKHYIDLKIPVTPGKVAVAPTSGEAPVTAPDEEPESPPTSDNQVYPISVV